MIYFRLIIVSLLAWPGFRQSCIKQPAELFPNSIGNRWTYILNGGPDSATHLIIEVIGSMQLPNRQTAKIWVYRFPKGVDTNYVVSNNKEVIIYNSYYNFCNPCEGIMPVEKLRFKLPLTVGELSTLEGDYGDTVTVVSKSDFNSNGKTYPGTYTLMKFKNRAVRIGNTYGNETFLITEKIGITSFKQMGNLQGQYRNGVWQLVNYEIK